MKKTKIIYWIFTGLAAAMMLLSGITNAIVVPESIPVFEHLGYPTYLISFLGVAKILGAIMILIPGFPRLKEWAYAGLVYDLVGAIYSHIASGVPFTMWVPILLPLLLLAVSYIYYYKLQKLSATIGVRPLSVAE